MARAGRLHNSRETSAGKYKRFSETYDSYHSVVVQSPLQPFYELNGEQLGRLSATCKHIVNDIVELVFRMVYIDRSILNDSSKIGWQRKVIPCKVKDNRINLNDRRLDAMSYKRSRRGTYSKATSTVSIYRSNLVPR